ncbi:hypothetical protein [Mycolicibacterium sp. S2-37]|uniref:hypothetical protein n=1 Tax=Mycolicibacterium sp. S2-37 TaxID=2810297 RepID=UPI001F5E582C|nr:hypothetical protein [Mycolicibacterium sp. S2-37]
MAAGHAEESALQTISGLQASGYTVNIDRVGSAPLAECVVTGVRNPQTVTEYVRTYDGTTKDGGVDVDVVPIVTSRSISVSLNCT